MPSLSPNPLRTGVVQQTTDGTQTAAATFATVNDTSYQVVARIIATETADHDETAGYILAGTFKNDGGTLSLVGSVTTVHSAENTAGWAATMDANSTNIRVLVTGAASTTINWRVDTEIYAVS